MYQFEGQSIAEETANSITHGIGALLSIAATAVLVVTAAVEGSPLKVVSFSIFGFTLCLLYTISSLYHGFQKPTVKRLFHIFDHSAIFWLIAGTYTPITLIALQGTWGWSLFGITWGLAALGTIGTLLFFEKARYFNVALYILMGWLITVASARVVQCLSVPAILLLAAGGLCYTGGVLFYRAKNLRGHHAVWHLFVLAGSTCHFFLMTTL